MAGNIKVNLEVFLTLEELDANRLKPGMEIEIGDPALLVSVNRLPFYEGKLKRDGQLVLCRISRILDTATSMSLKEKFFI
ncbi:MAG: hypothetical protein GXN94_01110 [Aquificae bacterium]|nr:hypothetical protein [Aquificota bacterium]